MIAGAQQSQMGYVSLCRDGGLKRAKVKASFKEQQQKQYSSMVVGEDSSSNSDWSLPTLSILLLENKSWKESFP